jgi:hypothetical protein
MRLRRTAIIICVAALALSVACTRAVTHTDSGARPASAARVAPDALHTLEGARTLRVSAETTDAAEPAVAAVPDGTGYVAWVEHGVGGAADVRLAHVGGDGQQLSDAPARVNTEAGAATAWRGDPPTVVLAPDGTIYVGWTARVGGAPHATALELSASHDGGHTFDAPVQINDDTKPGAHGMHSLAIGADGRVYVAWLDERDADAPMQHMEPMEGGKHKEGNRELFFASSADGGRTFSANRLVAREACPCCKTALAVGQDGRVYVSWRQVLPGEFRHIAVASTTDAGQTFSPPVVVSDDRWQIAGCPVSGSALSVAADGALRVLWYAAGEGAPAGLYLSESRDGGRTFAPRAPFVERSGSNTPIIVRGDAGDAVVWEDQSAGSPRIATASLDAQAQTAARSGVLAGAGESPAASAAGGRTFVAYTRGENGRRELWIISAGGMTRGGA